MIRRALNYVFRRKFRMASLDRDDGSFEARRSEEVCDFYLRAAISRGYIKMVYSPGKINPDFISVRRP